MNDRLHDVETTQQLMGGIARTTVFELIRSGELGSVKVGRRRMVPQSQIDAYIRAHMAR
jgi:excisionase family DNA binding protein